MQINWGAHGLFSRWSMKRVSASAACALNTHGCTADSLPKLLSNIKSPLFNSWTEWTLKPSLASAVRYCTCMQTACLNHPRHQKWEESKAENPNRNSLFPYNDKAQCCFGVVVFFSSCIHMQSVFTFMGFSWLPIYLKWTNKCCEVTEFRQNKAKMFLLFPWTPDNHCISLVCQLGACFFIAEVRAPSGGITVYCILVQLTSALWY